MSSRLYRFLTLAWVGLALYQIVLRGRYINPERLIDSIYLGGAMLAQLVIPAYFVWRNVASWRSGTSLLPIDVKTTNPVAYRIAIAILAFLCALSLLLLAAALADLLRWRIALAETRNLPLFLSLAAQTALPAFFLIELSVRRSPGDGQSGARA